MVRPRLSICSQRHINTLDTTAITHLFTGSHIDDLHMPSQNQKLAVNYFYNLLNSLNKLRSELNKFKVRKVSNSLVTTMSGKIYNLSKLKEKTKRINQEDSEQLEEEMKSLHNDSMLKNWSQLTDHLTMRPLITTLLPDGYLRSLASKNEEFIIHCQKMGIRCTLREGREWEPWLHSDFFG